MDFIIQSKNIERQANESFVANLEATSLLNTWGKQPTSTDDTVTLNFREIYELQMKFITKNEQIFIQPNFKSIVDNDPLHHGLSYMLEMGPLLENFTTENMTQTLSEIQFRISRVVQLHRDILEVQRQLPCESDFNEQKELVLTINFSCTNKERRFTLSIWGFDYNYPLTMNKSNTEITIWYGDLTQETIQECINKTPVTYGYLINLINNLTSLVET